MQCTVAHHSHAGGKKAIDGKRFPHPPHRPQLKVSYSLVTAADCSILSYGYFVVTASRRFHSRRWIHPLVDYMNSHQRPLCGIHTKHRCLPQPRGRQESHRWSQLKVSYSLVTAADCAILSYGYFVITASRRFHSRRWIHPFLDDMNSHKGPLCGIHAMNRCPQQPRGRQESHVQQLQDAELKTPAFTRGDGCTPSWTI